MDFSFICKHCNNLYEISLSSLPPEVKDLIVKIKTDEKMNMSQIKDKNTLINSKNNNTTIFSGNIPNFKVNGINMNFISIDKISILDIIKNLELILKNEICDNCYKELTSINEKEIKKIDEEISKLEKTKNILEKEISLNNEEENKNYKKSKIEDSKSQEEATKRLKQDNEQLRAQLNDNIEKLKTINEDEEKILDKINELKIDILLTSKDYELEKSIQQKNQFEQLTLLNSNIIDSLFDIEINEKYGIINGCKMIFKNYSSFPDIFSGWGHILLLTNIINLKAKKFLNKSNFKDGYEICNLGDYSYIYNTIDKKKYIFYERNSNLNDDSKARELNQSMLQYLEVLKDIDNKMKMVNGNSSGLGNFVINASSINHYHIELNINISNDYDWALCIKSLLILLKYYINVIVCKENEELKKIIE